MSEHLSIEILYILSHQQMPRHYITSRNNAFCLRLFDICDYANEK
jgi:hypothetical protein